MKIAVGIAIVQRMRVSAAAGLRNDQLPRATVIQGHRNNRASPAIQVCRRGRMNTITPLDVMRVTSESAGRACDKETSEGRDCQRRQGIRSHDNVCANCLPDNLNTIVSASGLSGSQALLSIRPLVYTPPS